MKFIPARNKAEVVARISQLTNSGPEFLGPGSKEHKSVLINLAQGMGILVEKTDTKQELASKIAEKFDLKWTSDCESIGQTITLKGLNLLLEAGAHYFANTREPIFKEMTLEQELQAISKIVMASTPKIMNGKEAVMEMREAEYSQWKQTEWQGFFFEFKVRPELINSLGGGPLVIGNTEFDYSLSRIWDMKTHSSTKGNKDYLNTDCLLNDCQSINLVTEQYGFGLIIVTGRSEYDMEFTKWHKKFRSGRTEEPRKLLKKSFTSERIDFFYVPNYSRLMKAKQDGQIKIFKQGRQQSGAKRAEKYSLNVKKSINSDLHVFTGALN